MVGGFLGYSLGVLLALSAGGELSLATYVVGYAVILFGDLSTHFSNDYYDADLDREAPHKTFGGSNYLADHPEAKPQALATAATFSAISTLLALLMVLTFGSSPLIPVIVVAANLFGWLYSAPPIKLNSRGLSEAIIALGTGFAIPAVGYVLVLGVVDQFFMAFSVPLVVYGFLLSLNLELPDLEVDREHGRKNLVVLAGRRRVALLIVLLSLAAEGYVILFAAEFSRYYMLPLLAAAPLVAGVRNLSSYSPSQANRSSGVNIAALFFFLICLDIYLISLL